MSCCEEEFQARWKRFQSLKERFPKVIVNQHFKQRYCYWEALIYDDQENRVFHESSTCGINGCFGYNRIQIHDPFTDDDGNVAWRVPFVKNTKFSNRLILDLDKGWMEDFDTDMWKEHQRIIFNLHAGLAITGLWGFGFPGEMVDEFNVLFSKSHEEFYYVDASESYLWDRFASNIWRKWVNEELLESREKRFEELEKKRRHRLLRFHRKRHLNVNGMQMMAMAGTLKHYANTNKK